VVVDENHAVKPNMGRVSRLGGVVDHGAREEDGPGTWEARVSPRATTGAPETR